MTWAKALAWRLGRQLLDRSASVSVVDVVGRLGAVPAWPDLTAELAVGARRATGRSGDVARALGSGELVKVFVFRGATHYLTPRDAGDYLSLRASSRMWELPSWTSYYGLAPEDWPRFREYVRNALAERPLTRTELAAALGRSSRYRHLRSHVVDGNDTLLKPLTWQGDMGLGPGRDGEVTFLRLDTSPGWGGMPDVGEAGPRVVQAYLRAFGPATPEQVQRLARRRARRQAQGHRRLARWPRRPPCHRRRRTRTGARPPRRSRRARGEPAVDRSPAPAGPRPVGDGAWHRRSPRRAAGPAGTGQQIGEPGRRPGHRRRDLDDPRRPSLHHVVRRGRQDPARRARRGMRPALVIPRPSPRALRRMTVRVRFAPSPTGSLHLGNALTAAANRRFADDRGGTLVLRIDDTDAARAVADGVEAIVADLDWLGIAWDEGPVRQSERAPIYADAAATAEREGGAVRDTDGSLRLDGVTLVRPDGTATYQLATVADDLDLSITHVIRGSDHRPNEAVQRRIARALGAAAPRGDPPRPAARRGREEALEASRPRVGRRLPGRGNPRGGASRVPRRARPAGARRAPRPGAHRPACDRGHRGDGATRTSRPPQARLRAPSARSAARARSSRRARSAGRSRRRRRQRFRRRPGRRSSDSSSSVTGRRTTWTKPVPARSSGS